MQKCESCGAYFSDFDKACPHCGWTTEPEQEAKEEPEVKPESNENIPPYSGTYGTEQKEAYPPRDREEYESPFTPPADRKPYPMKWHNFLMVIMIIGPVISIITGFQGVLNPLSTEDLLFSIAGIGLAVFGIVVRNRLNQFRKGSPNQLLILYAVTAGMNMLNTYLSYQAIKDNDIYGMININTSLAGEIIGALVIILLTRMYYNRRKELFVN